MLVLLKLANFKIAENMWLIVENEQEYFLGRVLDKTRMVESINVRCLQKQGWLNQLK